jgi:hypothetical protein
MIKEKMFKVSQDKELMRDFFQIMLSDRQISDIYTQNLYKYFPWPQKIFEIKGYFGPEITVTGMKPLSIVDCLVENFGSQGNRQYLYCLNKLIISMVKRYYKWVGFKDNFIVRSKPQFTTVQSKNNAFSILSETKNDYYTKNAEKIITNNEKLNEINLQIYNFLSGLGFEDNCFYSLLLALKVNNGELLRFYDEVTDPIYAEHLLSSSKARIFLNYIEQLIYGLLDEAVNKYTYQGLVDFCLQFSPSYLLKMAVFKSLNVVNNLFYVATRILTFFPFIKDKVWLFDNSVKWKPTTIQDVKDTFISLEKRIFGTVILKVGNQVLEYHMLDITEITDSLEADLDCIYVLDSKNQHIGFALDGNF